MFEIANPPFNSFVAVNKQLKFSAYSPHYLFGEDFNKIIKHFVGDSWDDGFMHNFLKAYFK